MARAGGWWRAALAAARALLAALALHAAPIAAQQSTHKVDPDDALLFDARLGSLQIGHGVRAFNTSAGLCLDFGDVLDALQIAITIDPGARGARGWAFDENHRVEIDRDKGEVRFAGEYAKLTPDTIWESRSGWCVLAPELGRWLGLTFTPDTSNAILGIAAKGALPIEAAAKRAAAAERLRGGKDKASDLPRVALPYRAWRMPSLDVIASAAVQDRGDGLRRETRYELFGAGELAWFSAEARLSSDTSGAPQALRLRLYRSDIAAQLLGPAHATEFALGDVASPSTALGVQATPGRGAAITNRPIGTASRFDTTDFTGVLPRGWDVELYRNGELLRSETASTLGRYEFRDVELRYGVNAFEIVAYGPQGQVRRERRSYNIGAQMPVGGETWYYADIVEDRRDLIEFSRVSAINARRFGWRADLGVEQGLGHGTSIALAAHRIPVLDGARTLLEGSLRASPFGTLAQLEVAANPSGGQAYRANLFGQLWRTNFSIETIRNFGLASERLNPEQNAITAIALDKPVRAFGLIVPIRFDLRETQSHGEHLLAARGRVSIATRRFSASLIGSWQRQSIVGSDSREEALAGLLLNSRLGHVRVRGEIDLAVAPRLGLQGASAAANWSLGSHDEVQATLTHNGNEGLSSAGLSYTRDFSAFSLSGNGLVDSRGGFALGLSLQFGIGRDARGAFGRFRSTAQAASGAVAVMAFQDLNGDGLRQDDEPFTLPPGLLVNDVPIAPPKHPQPSETAILIDGLSPALPVRVSLDESAIPDPFQLPSNKGVAAVPRAGLVTPVLLGITATSTVDGTLLIDGRAAAGEVIELVDAKGQVAYRLRTEFDGFFSFERVRYGEYRLQLARGARVLAEQVSVGPDRPAVRLGTIERQQSLAAAP